jgi:hypothetical protein
MYQRVWDEIRRRQEAVADDLLLRKPQRLARLREMQKAIEAAMAQADEHARQFVTGDLPRAYELGAHAAGAGFEWAGPHVEAAQVLARDTYDDLLRASKTVNRTTRKFVKEAAQVAVERAVVGGDTAVEAARAAARRLIEEHGIHAVFYRDGSRHGLAEYADVVVRTKTAVAYNEGSFNQMAQLGIRYAECFDGPSCGLDSHNERPLANGLVMPIDEARLHPISHPRCQRSWSPRPDVTSAAEAKNAKPSATPEQLADAAAAEQDRIAKSRERRVRASTSQRRRLANERRKASRRRTPAQTTPGLTAEQSAALIPTGGDWDAAVYERTAAALNTSEHGRVLLHTVSRYQASFPYVSHLREVLRRRLTGASIHDLPATLDGSPVIDVVRGADTLTAAIRSYDGPRPDVLYRGMNIRGKSAREVADAYPEGATVDLEIGSFTSDVTIAEEFTQNAGVPVILELAGEGSRVLPLQNMTTLNNSSLWREAEWLSQGRYKVLGTKKTGRTLTVRLAQVQ